MHDLLQVCCRFGGRFDAGLMHDLPPDLLHVFGSGLLQENDK